MSQYFYLDITLEFEKNINKDVTVAFFKKHVLNALNALHGEVGASSTVDILKYDSNTRRAVLRIPIDNYIQLRNALTLAGDYDGIPCAYRIHNCSAYLLNLIGDSSSYVH